MNDNMNDNMNNDMNNMGGMGGMNNF